MDKNRVNGAAEQAEGRVQKAAGDLTGNKETKAKGTIKEAEGKVKSAVGQATDSIKKATK